MHGDPRPRSSPLPPRHLVTLSPCHLVTPRSPGRSILPRINWAAGDDGLVGDQDQHRRPPSSAPCTRPAPITPSQ